MTRNLVSDETAEHNRTEGEGGYTFNAYPPEGYEGRVVVVAAVRIGDHAHVSFDSGRNVPQGGSRTDQIHRGHAGKITLAWDDWLLLREILDADERTRIAEVERPTTGQAWHHAGVDACIFEARPVPEHPESSAAFCTTHQLFHGIPAVLG